MSGPGKAILIVEDEPALAGVLKDCFTQHGFSVDHVAEGAGAVEHVLETKPDLVVLDVMLPGENGLDICRKLRKEADIPTILTTARVEEIDRLQGLELGADDYICKPYSPREVVARAKAVLRRYGRDTKASLSEQTVALDKLAWSATAKGRNLGLTRTEFLMLAVLVDNPGRYFSRTELIDRVFGKGRHVSPRTVDSHVKNLRGKLSAALSGDDPIRSLYGVGYSFQG